MISQPNSISSRLSARTTISMPAVNSDSLAKKKV
jgi:hypothetical protein